MKDFVPVADGTKKLITLVGIFAAASILANVVATKIADLGLAFATVAILFYPITFIIDNTISEVWGKHIARRVVWTGLIANILMTFVFFISIRVPAAPFYDQQQAFEAVLGSVPRIALASIVAYSISQHLDIFLFLGIRKKTQGKHLWLRNNVSTWISQLIDTAIFTFVAFFGTIPLEEIWGIITTEYTLKILIAVLSTPIVYLMVSWARKQDTVSQAA
ncbi:queuosine precursor transporter [Brevibacillus migulae]|uniref:queuosine precursor transporter n=1 Tax=Brevibacillus migulae TaxID=1644114 RepID=UPI00106E8195|nr:queuosine precursor transporter [Brevibacillus migulae]